MGHKMSRKYKVEWFMDSTYRVLEFKEGVSWGEEPYSPGYVVVFQGSISDCEAYIRLEEGGYL